MPAPNEAALQLIRAMEHIARYVQHRQYRAFRLEEGEYPCTCGLKEAKDEAAQAIAAMRALLCEPQTVDNAE